MIWLTSLRIAVRNLRAHALRSALTMLGIIIGVAAVITMTAVGSGAQRRIADKISSLGANLLMVQPGSSSEGSVRLGSGSRHTLTEEDAEAIRREVPGVEVAAPAVSSLAHVVKENRNWRTRITGTHPDYLLARDWPAAEGRHFTWAEEQTAAKVAVLGETVVEALFPSGQAVGQVVRIADTPFTVVGVLTSKGETAGGRDQDDGVFVPLSTAKLRLGGSTHEVNRQSVHYVLVRTAGPESLTLVQADVRALLAQRHRTRPGEKEDFTVRDLAATHSVHQESTRTLSILLAVVASISLVVGGVGIMNIMLVSVAERTREIGLRMAVGARARDVRNQFLVEAVIVCLAGGLIGVVVGAASAAATAIATGWPVYLGPEIVLVAAAFSAAVGIAFGLYPALKAARLSPIEALRRE